MLCRMCSLRGMAALPSSESHLTVVFILSKLPCAHQHWLLVGLTNVQPAFGMHMIPGGEREAAMYELRRYFDGRDR